MIYCCYVSIVYSSLDVFYIVNFLFSFFNSFCVACAFVICLLKHLLTYFTWRMLRRLLFLILRSLHRALHTVSLTNNVFHKQ